MEECAVQGRQYTYISPRPARPCTLCTTRTLQVHASMHATAPTPLSP